MIYFWDTICMRLLRCLLFPPILWRTLASCSFERPEESVFCVAYSRHGKKCGTPSFHSSVISSDRGLWSLGIIPWGDIQLCNTGYRKKRIKWDWSLSSKGRKWTRLFENTYDILYWSCGFRKTAYLCRYGITQYHMIWYIVSCVSFIFSTTYIIICMIDGIVLYSTRNNPHLGPHVTRFASGGADKQVIIWTHKAQYFADSWGVATCNWFHHKLPLDSRI